MEDQVWQAVAESERLWAELEATRRQLETADTALTDLRGEVQRLRVTSTLPVRRTLGQLATARKDGE